MKLIDVGTEHFIVMMSDTSQVMFHHELPVAAKIHNIWYRSLEIKSLLSIGHVQRYLAHLQNTDIYFVRQELLNEYVREL